MNIWLINPYDDLPGEGAEGRYGALARLLAERVAPQEMADGRWQIGQVVWVSSAFRHRGKWRKGSESRVYAELKSGVYAAGSGAPRSAEPMQGRTGISACPSPEGSVGIPPEGGTPNILLVDAPSYRKNVSLARLWSQFMWGRNVFREMSRRVASGELERPDVVLASSPPLEGAWAGIRLARRFGATSVVDFMDDWPATWLAALPGQVEGNWIIRKLGIGVGSMLLWPWYRLARKVYASADAVSAQSYTFAERARELGHEGEVHVCYLGGAAAPLEMGDGSWEMGEGSHSKIPRSPNSDLPSPEREAFHILYLGGMGQVYDIGTVLHAAKRAQEEGLDWQWTLAGEDPDGQWIRRVEELGLGAKVRLPGFVTGDDLSMLKASSDVGLVPMDPDSKVAVPYKLGEYCMAGLAVVNSLPGEAQALLRAVRSAECGVQEKEKEKGSARDFSAFSQHKYAEGENAKNQGLTPFPFPTPFPAGVYYEYGNAASLLEALRGLAEDPQRLEEMKAASRRLGEEVFDREKSYPGFVEWLVCRSAGTPARK